MQAPFPLFGALNVPYRIIELLHTNRHRELLSTRCGFDSRTGRCGMISRNREIIPFFIYASNEPKSVLARNLGDCRDNLRNSQSVFLIVGNLINNFLLVLLENRNFMRGEFTCGFGGSC